MAENWAALLAEFSEQVKQASAAKTPLRIIGGGSKSFYGRESHLQGDSSASLDVRAYQGVISYDPTELVITARAGTPLADLEAVLRQNNQMLPFEPPHFGENATLGGAVACGLSGPRRPYTGSVRDFVLGCKLLDGKGEALRFGGQVMKNVAGYDVPRLMTGALGTLGVLLEISLKVLPVPAAECTYSRVCTQEEALVLFNTWAGKPLPISGAVHDGERLFVRLSGAASAVTAAQAEIAGNAVADSKTFWRSVREHSHAYFRRTGSLWRFSLPPATPPLDIAIAGVSFIDWGGAQRWLYSDAPGDKLFALAARCGGHACLFRGGDRRGRLFQPLEPVVLKLHQRLKNSFDPAAIFNPGRLYPEI